MRNIIVETFQRMEGIYEEPENMPVDQDQEMAVQQDTIDTVTMDVPLLIRMVEMGREEIEGDEQLHRIIQNVISAANAKQGQPLTMDDYDMIVQDEQFKMEPEPGAEDETASDLIQQPSEY